MKIRSSVYCLVLILTLLQPGPTAALDGWNELPAHAQLLQALSHWYPSSKPRPVWNFSDPVHVFLDFSLYQIISVVSRNLLSDFPIYLNISLLFIFWVLLKFRTVYLRF